MSKLLALLVTLGALSGFAINSSDVESIFASNEYTQEEKDTAIAEITSDLEEVQYQLENNCISFGTHQCNNF